VQLIGLTIVYTSTTLVDGFVLGASWILGLFPSERYKRARGVTLGESRLHVAVLLFLPRSSFVMY